MLIRDIASTVRNHSASPRPSVLRYGAGMQIDPASPDYPYVQLADYLRSQIGNGQITDVLPSILTLSQQWDVAPNTVRRAFRLLLDEGLIETRQGRGTFVRRE